MNLRKGISIINIKAFVTERFGPDSWEKLLATMCEADRTILSSAVHEGWYEMALHERVNRAFCDCFYDGNLAGAEELGRFSAERDLAGVRRWILSLVRPSFVLRHMDAYWRQDEGSGSWTTDVRGDELTTKLSGWQGGDVILCRRLVGYIARMLETSGVLTRPEHLHGEGDGATSCTFRFGWKLERDVPCGARISSKEELVQVARELELFPDVATLADAIVELIHVQLSYPRISFWVQPIDSNGLMLVREVGVKGTGTPLCAMLQRGGRTVGHLEVTPGPDSRRDLLDELVPLLALPLDAVRHSGGAPDMEAIVARRLLVARRKWQVTAKETDVLEMLLRGRRYKEIAEALGCMASTVEQHVVHILRKSKCESRSALSWTFWTEL